VIVPKKSSPTLNRNPPTTMADYVTEAIRAGILDGQYPMGAHLDQQALADELGASIIPVRESLRQLEAEGLVRITPRRGAFVVELSDDEVREVYRLRAVLESYAAKEAVPALSAEDVAELEDLFQDLVRLDRKDAHDQWSNLNQAWHFKLYSGARSPLLLHFISALWDRCRLTSHAYARDVGHRSSSDEDHGRVMEAVRQRDADLAAMIISLHVRNAMDDLLSKESD
jgi:DNA-binding GntR family transcriptional regulator